MKYHLIIKKRGKKSFKIAKHAKNLVHKVPYK